MWQRGSKQSKHPGAGHPPDRRPNPLIATMPRAWWCKSSCQKSSKGTNAYSSLAANRYPFAWRAFPKAVKCGTTWPQPEKASPAHCQHGTGKLQSRWARRWRGVDVIGDCVTEINVTSPTCFQEIQEQTGCDVASLFIDALDAAVATHSG